MKTDDNLPLYFSVIVKAFDENSGRGPAQWMGYRCLAFSFHGERPGLCPSLSQHQDQVTGIRCAMTLTRRPALIDASFIRTSSGLFGTGINDGKVDF